MKNTDNPINKSMARSLRIPLNLFRMNFNLLHSNCESDSRKTHLENNSITEENI
jgi:hypothetical protein